MSFLKSFKAAFGGAAGGGKTEAMDAESDRLIQSAAAGRMRRRWLKSRRRFYRWPIVRTQSQAERAEAYRISLENGLIHRALERVGKPRSKYCPRECQLQGNR